eukprot:TRINITY_DN2508_c0_g1_i1.p1 TRINITY_DN2508_c0_g1~~TRINITY_DN2508_c0_g1_i1.p1  ORF type:complete len:649 (-),score=132.77 TRINITY_DN2508_c0_g1_i1:60-2006(-)
MSLNRKLQGEIDRLLKKVVEGCEEFDEILSKVHSASSSNQKEKYETDLKKEIKKLQRARDQIKAWIASNDVKQKNPLLDARKNIESKMEQFKACERETKMKAFSKEGLSQSVNDDDGKKEQRQWIGKCLRELREQIDQTESELESIGTTPVAAKKGKATNNSKIDELTERLERHNFHVDKLEKVLRNLENDTITTTQVDEIQESVDYYVESNQDPEFMYDPDIYEALNLKEEDDMALLRSSDAAGDWNDDSDSDDETPSSSGHSSLTNSSSSSAPKLSSSANVPKELPKKVEPTPPPPAVKTTTTPTPPAPLQYSILSNNLKKQAQLQTPTQPVQPQPQTPTQSQPPVLAQTPVQIQPQKKTATTPTAPIPQVAPPVVVLQNNAAQKQSAPAIKVKTSQPAVVTTSNSLPTKTPSPVSQTPAQSSGSISTLANSVIGSQSVDEEAKTASFDQFEKKFQQQSGDNMIKDDVDDSRNNETFDSSNHTDAGTLAELANVTHQKFTGNHGDNHNSILSLLESGLKYTPDNMDSEKMKPKSKPFSTPSYYPQVQSSIFENPALFGKFDTDTLFLIFYFQQGTYQQYLAAKELKKQSWRYHKKYLTWFQRHEEPKEISNDYEQGTYVYFDYETGWCQRKKTEFTFEYRFLEDYD